MSVTIDDLRAGSGKATVQCGNCGWSNGGALTLVDRCLNDSPPGPLNPGDMLEVYADKYMDPDDRITNCRMCDEEFLNDELGGLEIFKPPTPEERDKLIEALNFYADGRHYIEGEWSVKLQKVVTHINRDGGKRARAALGQDTC